MGKQCYGGIVIIKYKRRLMEKDGSCYVCIPARIRKGRGLKKGDVVDLYGLPGSGLYVFLGGGLKGNPKFPKAVCKL